jgi:hypothetical protein
VGVRVPTFTLFVGNGERVAAAEGLALPEVVTVDEDWGDNVTMDWV